MHVIRGSRLRNRIAFWLWKLKRAGIPQQPIDLVSTNGSGTGHVDQVFVLNLDRQSGRWRRFQKEASRLRINGHGNLLRACRRVSAIDGRRLDLSSFDSADVETTYTYRDHAKVDSFQYPTKPTDDQVIHLTAPEIAIGLSHLKIWREIYAQNIRYAMVLEDDVYFDERFQTAFQRLWEHLPPPAEDGYRFDLLQLSYQAAPGGLEMTWLTDILVQPIRGFYWLSGYVISRRGVAKLLDSLPIRGPIDVWMNLQFSEIEAFAAAEPLIQQRTDWKTDNDYSIYSVIGNGKRSS